MKMWSLLRKFKGLREAAADLLLLTLSGQGLVLKLCFFLRNACQIYKTVYNKEAENT